MISNFTGVQAAKLVILKALSEPEDHTLDILV